MKQRIAKGWSLLLAMLVLLSVLPVGALAEEAQQPAGELGAVYQWTDGEQGYALMETRDTLGGDEAGYSAAQTFPRPWVPTMTVLFTASSLPGRRPAMTSWPACFPTRSFSPRRWTVTARCRCSCRSFTTSP